MLIKVFLVDDHDIVRMGVARMLDDIKDLVVVGQAKTGEEAITSVRQLKPDVVLMDIQMPGIGGVEATRILDAGASDYITKGTCLDEMVQAIRKVAAGERYFSAEIALSLAKNWANRDKAGVSPFDLLSRREIQLVQMIADGKSNQDIADIMGIAISTLSTYRYRIYNKLEIENDVQLTHLAIRFALVQKE